MCGGCGGSIVALGLGVDEAAADALELDDEARPGARQRRSIPRRTDWGVAFRFFGLSCIELLLVAVDALFA